MTDLPPIALSVRQPWARAIVTGYKDVENRTAGSIRAGGMGPGRIAIHAASAMRRSEYEWAAWRMSRDGVRVPRPETLARRAVVGAVTVTGIVLQRASPWFGGPMGLTLAEAATCEPVPAAGALGYFRWVPDGACAPVAAWMREWDRAGGGEGEPSMFPDLARERRAPPPKPWRPR